MPMMLPMVFCSKATCAGLCTHVIAHHVCEGSAPRVGAGAGAGARARTPRPLLALVDKNQRERASQQADLATRRLPTSDTQHPAAIARHVHLWAVPARNDIRREVNVPVSSHTAVPGRAADFRSHCPSVGCIVDNFPPGVPVSEDVLQPQASEHTGNEYT